MDQKALDGIKVLDLTQAMAGPIATMLLGDLGAEVIKVEPPAGDQTRKWAPPYLNGMSAYFLSANRNKKSLVLDLKEEEGKEILRKLIANSDIIIENFRPGTMKKMGFSYDAVSQIKRDIIYCSLSGYGQTGPEKNSPGYDLTVLANSGLMSINGEPERPPVKFGVPISDIIAGLFSDIAIMAAIIEKQKSGKGQFIDMAMLDANFLILTHQAMGYFATGNDPERLGSAHSSIAPYQVFGTSDGYIAITVGTEKLWENFVKTIEREDLASRPEFKTNVERVTNREKLAKELNDAFRNYTVKELYGKLTDAGIPSAPINKISEAVANPQIIAREMIKEVDSSYGRFNILGTPFKMSRTPGSIELAPPMKGEQSLEILKQLGYNEKELENLSKKGIITTNPEVDNKS